MSKIKRVVKKKNRCKCITWNYGSEAHESTLTLQLVLFVHLNSQFSFKYYPPFYHYPFILVKIKTIQKAISKNLTITVTR